MILKRQQKADLVIKLAEEGNNKRDITKVEHILPKDIGILIRRHIGKEEESICQDKGLSINSRSFKLFKENNFLF